jgi:hypothetical protein
VTESGRRKASLASAQGGDGQHDQGEEQVEGPVGDLDPDHDRQVPNSDAEASPRERHPPEAKAGRRKRRPG